MDAFAVSCLSSVLSRVDLSRLEFFFSGVWVALRSAAAAAEVVMADPMVKIEADTMAVDRDAEHQQAAREHQLRHDPTEPSSDTWDPKEIKVEDEDKQVRGADISK